MSLLKLIKILFSAALIISQISYSQDTTKKKIDTTYKPVKFILSDYRHSYLNQTNPDTVTRRRFLWYPTKNLEDIFNYLPGYYLNYMDVGQLNPISYNQFAYYNTAILRHGRPINDLLGSTIDYNLLSRNEIAEVELTNGFGNLLYNYSNAINIIDRQIFQYRPYTEISFFQDRYENLYFDGNYHQNLFKNLNYNFGVTKHSYDGKYTNSDFDKWLGRFNFNFAASNKLNFFLYSNYAKIQRGLNEGIDSDTVNLGSKEDMFDISKAIVRNSDAYERKERFDIDLGAVFLAGKNSFTKLQLFVSNSFREYRDEENRPNPNGIFIQDNDHWINYGIKLQQVLNFKLAKKFDIISRSEGEYNNILTEQGISFTDTSLNFRSDYTKFIYFTDILVGYKNVTLEAFIKGYTTDNFKNSYLTSGIKAAYTFNIDSLKKISIFGQYNTEDNYSGGGLSFKLTGNELTAKYYNYKIQRILYNPNLLEPPGFADDYIDGIDILARFRVYKIDFSANYSANFKLKSDYVPKHFGTADLSFHDVAFKNKLEYKIGFVTRAWSKYKASFYSGINNSFYGVSGSDISIPSNATLDFYIIGKIGRATFGLTLENILNRLVYNTGVYPFMDRGGLFNVISRFNITWNFLD